MNDATKTPVAFADTRQGGTQPPAIDVDALPLLSDTAYFGQLLGWGPTYTARLCKQGRIPAVRVGRSWRINTREALRAMGLLHDQR